MHANIDDFQTRNLVKIISKCIRILMILRPQDLPVVVTGLDFRVRAGRDFWYFFESLLKYLGIPWNFLKFPLPLYGDLSSYTVFWASPCHRVVDKPIVARDTFSVFWARAMPRIQYRKMQESTTLWQGDAQNTVYEKNNPYEGKGNFLKNQVISIKWPEWSSEDKPWV